MTRKRGWKWQRPGRWTPRQGQFLAFIHAYTNLNGRPPAETDMERFFQISPPSVHHMILRLEERGLVSRVAGEPRSIQLLVPPEELPALPDTVHRPFDPAPVRPRVSTAAKRPARAPAAVVAERAPDVPQPDQLTLFDLSPVSPSTETVEERPKGPTSSTAEPPTPATSTRRRAPGNVDELEAFGRVRAYAFRVTLKWDRKVWRVIEVRGDQTLHHLHHGIQEAFGWDDDHLYSFFMSGKRWDPRTEYAAPGAEGRHKANRVMICALSLALRQRFLYLFDYGDELLHDVWLVRTAPAEAGPEYPRIVEVHGESPPQYPVDDEA